MYSPQISPSKIKANNIAEHKWENKDAKRVRHKVIQKSNIFTVYAGGRYLNVTLRDLKAFSLKVKITLILN